MMAELYSAIKMDRFYVLTDDDYVAFRTKLKNIYIQKSKGFGVNLEEFHYDFMPSLTRREIGIDDGDFVLIYIGRLVKFKGFDMVLHVINKLNTEYSDRFKLIVCGTFDEYHPMELTEFEKSIWEYSKNIIKIGFTDNVKSYLKIADLNIFPSKREGLPVNIMESIAMGVPTITSNFRGCRHVIIPYVNGIIVENYDVNHFVKEILNYFKIPGYKESLINGCLSSRFLYNRKLYQNELIDIYKSIH